MAKIQYCLQVKTKWVDGDSLWNTVGTSGGDYNLLDSMLPAQKQHDKEAMAKSISPEFGIVGYEYRIVKEIVMLENL